MKKILSLFALLMAIVTGANGSGVADLKTISSDHTVIFEDIMGGVKFNDGTLYDSDYLLSVGGNNYANNKKSCSSLNNKLNCCRIKNASQDRLAFKVGDACTLKIYGETRNDRLPVLSTDGSATAKYEATHEDGADVMTFTIAEAGTYYIVGSGDRFLAGLEFTFAAATTAPVFTTDLSATADVTVGVAEEFTVDTDNATSYQWYKATSTTNDEAIEGATTATYSYTATAAGTVNLYCVATNNIGSTTSTVCAVTATAPANPPVITTDLEAAYNVIKNQTQVLSIVAEDASSYQWYLDGVAVEGATTDTYTFTAGSTIGATNAVYCAAINAAGTTNSVTATITTVGRADCEVTNIKFSNGAYGAINNATYGDGTIAVPYMAGTSAPTVEEASINISDGATYVLDGNTLTVTAEDETTSKEYTINAVEITPLNVSADVTENFTEVPSWVFNLYGYDNDKGLKFAKKVDEASNMRIAKGNTRQYYFIGAAKSLTLTKVGSTRKVNVYVNGTKVISDTNNDALGAITLDETAPCMVMIESNQTGGDGGFSAYAIEAAAAQSQNVTVGATGFATIGLPFAAKIPEGVTAYAVTAVSNGKVTTSEAIAAGEVLPANQGFIITAADNSAFTFTEAASATYTGTSLLQAAGADGVTATATAPIFVLAKISDTKVGFRKSINGTLGAYKAYLPGTNVSGESLEIDFGGAATAINGIAEADAEAAPAKVVKNGKLYIGNYNVAGQLVK